MVTLSERGCEGAPDFVCEVVSPSSIGMDYVTKLNLYREAGVREYWIADPDRRLIHAYAFDTELLLEVYDFTAPVPSWIIPSFSFDFGAVVAGM